MPEFFRGMALGALIPVVGAFVVFAFKEWVEGVAFREAERCYKTLLEEFLKTVKREVGK